MPELKQHFVAFLDILGFSQMVEAGGDSVSENLQKLYRCHQAAAAIFAEDANCSITQFSDSIVLSKPYDPNEFKWFAEAIANYQRLLLNEGLLCRGGVAVNTHFSNNSFTFSAGLIDAYRIESQHARYPRIVVSQDLLELVLPPLGAGKLPKYLAKEDDGLVFVDYLWVTRSKSPGKLSAVIKDVVAALGSSDSASVREKGRWLASYSDFVLGTTLGVPRFLRHRK